MPKVIVKIQHTKATGGRGGFASYIAKRKGVDKSINDMVVGGDATEKQKNFIEEVIAKYPEEKDTFEYQDYIENPTRNNASEFISSAVESNPDLCSSRDVYLNYISTRPRVEKFGSHGLFGAEDDVELEKVKKELGETNSVMWTPIISLRREDAARLGYDNAQVWKDLLRSKQIELAEIFDIPIDKFKWYAAFHDESHHPHVHMVVFSSDGKDGFITVNRIEKIKSMLVNEIFKNEMYELYDDKTKMREKISEESKQKLSEIAERIKEKDYSESEVGQMIYDLAVKLKDVKGKKTYGYLNKSLKAEVDNIMKAMSKDDDINELYGEWCKIQKKIVGMYNDKDVEFPPLYKNDEFKKIKNAIIKECEKLGNDYILKDEIENENEEREWSENSENRQSNEEYKFELNSQIALSTLNLFCRMSRIIENDSDRKIEGFNKTIVDSRERKREMERKHRMGIKMG